MHNKSFLWGLYEHIFEKLGNTLISLLSNMEDRIYLPDVGQNMLNLTPKAVERLRWMLRINNMEWQIETINIKLTEKFRKKIQF